MSTERTQFRAEVRDVLSGDDLKLWVDLGVDDLYKRKRFRLLGVDTPNAVGCGPYTEAGKVRTLVYELTKRRPLRIEVQTITNSSWIGTVIVERPEGDLDLNQYLIAQGYSFNRTKGST